MPWGPRGPAAALPGAVGSAVSSGRGTGRGRRLRRAGALRSRRRGEGGEETLEVSDAHPYRSSGSLAGSGFPCPSSGVISAAGSAEITPGGGPEGEVTRPAGHVELRVAVHGHHGGRQPMAPGVRCVDDHGRSGARPGTGPGAPTASRTAGGATGRPLPGAAGGAVRTGPPAGPGRYFSVTPAESKVATSCIARAALWTRGGPAGRPCPRRGGGPGRPAGAGRAC